MTNTELKKTHADYNKFLPEWLFYIRSYLGGVFYRDGNYLLRHPFESETNYKRRKEIAYFYNYCSPIVDILTSYVSKKLPQRSYGSFSTEPVPPRKPKTLFDSFWWNCDYENTTFEQFMRDVLRYVSIYGRVSVIVDKPSFTALSRSREIEEDIRPYLSIITPENILDWKFVKLNTGKTVLDYIKIKEENNYRIWTRQDWSLWFSNVEKPEPDLIESGIHNLNEIPIINIYNKKTGIKMIGISDLIDIADINKNIYYFCSDAKEIIENTAFPMLALPYETGVGGEETKTVGPKNILQFDPDKPQAIPQWLEPPHSSLAEIREWIQQDAQEMVRIAKMGSLRNIETSTQPWSGVSIEAQETQLFASLIEKAVNLEQAELEIFRLFGKWQGEVFDGDVQYPRDFAIRDLTIALQNAIVAGTTNINSVIFEKERQKKIVIAALPELEEVIRDNIFEEIEASVTKESMATS